MRDGTKDGYQAPGMAPEPRKVPSRMPKAQPEIALSPQQEDIRKLVGAEMPSHRGSWRAGSDSWKIFEGNDSDQTEEDSDDDTVSTVTPSRSESLECITPGSCFTNKSL